MFQKKTHIKVPEGQYADENGETGWETPPIPAMQKERRFEVDEDGDVVEGMLATFLAAFGVVCLAFLGIFVGIWYFWAEVVRFYLWMVSHNKVIMFGLVLVLSIILVCKIYSELSSSKKSKK